MKFGGGRGGMKYTQEQAMREGMLRHIEKINRKGKEVPCIEFPNARIEDAIRFLVEGPWTIGGQG